MAPYDLLIITFSVPGLGGALDSVHGGVPDNQSSSPESKSL